MKVWISSKLKVWCWTPPTPLVEFYTFIFLEDLPKPLLFGTCMRNHPKALIYNQKVTSIFSAAPIYQLFINLLQIVCCTAIKTGSSVFSNSHCKQENTNASMNLVYTNILTLSVLQNKQINATVSSTVQVNLTCLILANHHNF